MSDSIAKQEVAAASAAGAASASAAPTAPPEYGKPPRLSINGEFRPLSVELQSEYVGVLIASGITFESPKAIPKSAHGFEHLIPYLEGEVPDLHPLLRRVAEVARAEYRRFIDPLLPWRSESALHGPLRRLLRVVMTPEAADRGTCLSLSPRVRSTLGLQLADVCPDLCVGITADEIVIAKSRDDPPISEAPHVYASRHGVIPTLGGVSLDADWFHFLFVESKPGGVRAGTLRLLTSMRAALQLSYDLFKKVMNRPNVRPMSDMALAYGVVTSGPCWEVHSMNLERNASGEVSFKTYRLWEGYVDRPRDLMQFIALMRIATVSAVRRAEIIGNWLWCLDGGKKRKAEESDSQPASKRIAGENGKACPLPRELSEVEFENIRCSLVECLRSTLNESGTFSPSALQCIMEAAIRAEDKVGDDNSTLQCLRTVYKATGSLPPSAVRCVVEAAVKSFEAEKGKGSANAPRKLPTAAGTSKSTSTPFATLANLSHGTDAQRWSEKQERIGQWRNGIIPSTPKLPKAEL